MNLRCAALVVCLTPSCGVAAAQQGMTGPVLSAPPPPLSIPSAQSPPSGANSARYVPAPEDSIQVTAWKEPSIPGSLPIRPDGMISLSLLGDLQAAGYTPMQLSTEITRRLEKFIQDPTLAVIAYIDDTVTDRSIAKFNLFSRPVGRKTSPIVEARG
jgi:polysaccharide export outer membrane protein